MAADATGSLGWGAWPMSAPYGLSAPPVVSGGGSLPPTSVPALSASVLSTDVQMYMPRTAITNFTPATATPLKGVVTINNNTNTLLATQVAFNSSTGLANVDISADLTPDLFPSSCPIPKYCCIPIYNANAGANALVGWGLPVSDVQLQTIMYGTTLGVPTTTAGLIAAGMLPMPLRFVNATANQIIDATWTTRVNGGFMCAVQLNGVGNPIAVPGFTMVTGGAALPPARTIVDVAYEVSVQAPGVGSFPT